MTPMSVDAATVAASELGAPASSDFARPKSMIFACPSSVSMTLAGLRSRCTMPCSCARARPSAISVASSSDRDRAERPRAIALAQRLAAHQLHRDEAHAVRFADLVNDADVRVLEPRGRLRLAEKPPAPIVVGDQVGRQDLQGDFSIERRIERAVDHAHPAPPELRQNAIPADVAPDQRFHPAAMLLRILLPPARGASETSGFNLRNAAVAERAGDERQTDC